ncbi:hypothetical protein PM082_003916 [Marasmius tenuissimus]|nr:hypothetical protein PM082_003916 [Marasmius tenuissimus]
MECEAVAKIRPDFLRPKRDTMSVRTVDPEMLRLLVFKVSCELSEADCSEDYTDLFRALESLKRCAYPQHIWLFRSLPLCTTGRKSRTKT